MSKSENKAEITKHAGGRPVKYESAEEMQTIIDQYFIDCEGKPLTNDDGEIVLNKYGEPVYIGKKPPTVTGLAIALGFLSRNSLINYSNKDEFFHTITAAKLRCQQYAESRLYDRDGANGAKFSLQNNFNWVDRSIVDNNNNNHNTASIDLSGMTISDMKQIIAACENKLIEADYSESDE